ALADRHIERGQGLRADGAGLLEAVARLEVPHPGGERLVIKIARDFVSRQVLGDGEALAQQRHFGTLGAERVLTAGRQRGPSALHFQRGVAEHGGADALDGVFVEGRLGRLRHHHLRSRLALGRRTRGDGLGRGRDDLRQSRRRDQRGQRAKDDGFSHWVALLPGKEPDWYGGILTAGVWIN